MKEDGVEAEHLDPAIGQHTHQVEEFAENVSVSPVEIPLEFVEGRPYPPLAVVVPGEIAMREVRKNVRKVLLPGVNLVLSRQNYGNSRGTSADQPELFEPIHARPLRG